MTEAERAEAFAESIACYGYPHSGAIEAYGAEFVKEKTPGLTGFETWAVGEHRIELRPDGVVLRRPLDTIDVTLVVR